MITKSLIVSILLYSSSLLADSGEITCDESLLSKEIEGLATSLQIPNCNTKINIKAANLGEFDPLCKTCIPEFKAALNINKVIKSEPEPIILNDVILDEFKRSLSSNLLDMVNLRSVYSTTADFSDAIKACDLDKFDQDLEKKGCTKGNSFKGLKDQMAEELGNLLSKYPVSNKKGILDRSNFKNTCHISDVAVLQAKSLTVENALTPEIVNQLANLVAKDQLSLRIAVSELKVKFPLASSLKSHPIFSHLMSSPENFTSFFQGIAKGYTKEKLTAALYANETTNTILTKGIAEKCRETFKNFEALACDKDLQNGHVKLNSLKDTRKYLTLTPMGNDKYIDLSSENDLSANQKLVALCSIKSDKKDAFDLDKGLETLSKFIPKDLSELPYEKYRTVKYEQDIGLTKNQLCETKPPCVEDSYNCALFNSYKNQSDPTTPEGRLVKSSDKSVNSLLRSFIGVPDKISASTKQTLIAEGILPKSSTGDLVPQPSAPEREPEYLNKLSEVAKTSPTAPASSASAAKTTSAATPTNTTKPTAAYPTSTPTNDSTTKTDTTSPTAAASTDPDMTDYNNEILKRLSQKNSDPKKPLTKDEARKATNDFLKAKAAKLSPTQQTALTDKVLASYNTSAALPSADDKATLPEGKTPNQDWADEQKYRALRKGKSRDEEAAARGPASETTAAGGGKVDAQGKTLSTVALNISEDKVKLNLSDVLDEKIIKDDPDGQLLKFFINNKNDFILQVNSISFKVKYDGALGAYSVAFDSGDKIVASRLKPQLEKFFKRVSATVVSSY
ncbi:MAG TPA: hypothetical protein VNJ08_14285 [Bacteriovoracaceae bacterium]|nr:hypothetical protein [Bacteriovoracaceae bacterium]